MSCRRREKEAENYNEINEILKSDAPKKVTSLLSPREFFEQSFSTPCPVVEKSIKNIHNDQFEYFKTLVQPGNVKRRELELFLEEFNVCDKDVNFSRYKMYMRQTVFSHVDLHSIMNAVRHASFKNQRFVQKTFKERVTKEEKRAGHKALTNISNFWLLYTNAFEEPQKLGLRGS